MKRIAAVLLLMAFSVGMMPGRADGAGVPQSTRHSWKADKQQEKRSKKAMKDQEKAIKKYEKGQQKAAKSAAKNAAKNGGAKAGKQTAKNRSTMPAKHAVNRTAQGGGWG